MLNQMIEDGKENRFDIIIIPEAEQFGKKVMKACQNEMNLLNYGVGVIFIENDIFTKESMRILKLEIMAQMLAKKKKLQSERAQDGLKCKGETPGQLEQRIKKSKLIPKCEKYRLRGQLMTLAELGVMPNQYIPPLFDEFTDSKTYYKVNKKIHGSPRSDIVLPLSAWRGENGICEKRFEELFGTR